MTSPNTLFDTLFISLSPQFVVSPKLALFDLDGTLITTASKKRFPLHTRDYQFLPNRMNKLTQLHQEGYSIVIITNQAYKDWSETIGRLEAVIKEFTIPIALYAALVKDWYRKPHSTILDNYFPLIDKQKSFYVGDAAGRPNDHSEVDRSFAYNCGLAFHTSEQFFEGSNEVLLPSTIYDPHLLDDTLNQKQPQPLLPDHQELLVTIGAPGSGKSSYINKYFISAGYAHVSLDIDKTVAKSVKKL